MMKEDGGPAFSSQPLGSDGLPEHGSYTGITKRDWFAGQALASIPVKIEWTPDEERRGYPAARAGAVAKMAYFIADAMLKAREA